MAVPGSPFPAPTGPYAVGRAQYHWRDPARDEARGSRAGEKRELVVWAWYPALPAAEATPAPYLPPGWEAAGQFWGFEPNGVVSHAVTDAPPAREAAPFPVLVFSPAGFPPLALTAILEELASHGYAVFGINHTYESTVTAFPDGRLMPMNAAWMRPVFGPFGGAYEDTRQGRAAIVDEKAADIRFVVDRLASLDGTAETLADRLDLARLGAFGHSLGGDAALAYCSRDARCRAAANLDGGIWNAVGREGGARPTLLLLAEHPEFVQPCEPLVAAGIYPSAEWCQAERAIALSGWQTVYERGLPGYAMLIQGSGHISFMDVPFLPVAPGSLVAGGLASVRIDARRAWRVICDYLLAFFARHVDGQPDALLDAPVAAYPEVVYGAPAALFAPAT